MKKIAILLLLIIGAFSTAKAQIPPTNIYGKDVVVTTRDTSSAELTIKNSTRNVTNGVLTNIGAGKTQFIALPSYTLLSRFLDSLTQIQIRIQSKHPLLTYTPIDPADTAAMLANRLKISDTSNMLSGYSRTGRSVQYSDTSGMLSNRLKISDTTNMLSGYARSGNVVKYTDVGVNNGVASLDAGGKVPFSQLPASLMIYKGTWNPTTNTPTLADGSGTTGWVYKASVNGTVNLGSGSITFYAGDYVIYNGATWERSGNTDLVVSVNGQQGVVSLTTANIPEGGTDYYWTAARSRAAQSVSVTGLTYNSTTGDISLTSGYGIPTTTNISNWNTAYGWGNHAGLYLPLTGGTLTGALVGTVANFYGSVVTLGSGAAFGIADRTNTSRLWNFYSPNGKIVLNSATGSGGVGDVMDWNYTTGLVTAYYGMTVTGTMTANNNLFIPTGVLAVQTIDTYSGTLITFNQNVTLGTKSITAGAGTFSGTVISTAGNSGTSFSSNAATTGYNIGYSISNTGGSAALAIESSTGGITVTGAPAYSTTLSTYNATSLVLGINQVAALIIDASRNIDIKETLIVRGNNSAYNTHYFTTGSANVAAYNQYNASGTLINRFYAGGDSYITGGNVGIGTASPAVTLDIYNATAVRFDMADNTNRWAQYIDNSTGEWRLRYANAALNVLTVTTAGVATFASNVIASTSFQANSTYQSSMLVNFTGSGAIKGNFTAFANTIAMYDETNSRYILNYNGSTNTLAVTQATTFASTVTATAIYESSDIRQKKVHTTIASADGINAIQYTFKPSGQEKWGYSAQQIQKIIPFAVTKGSDGFLKLDYSTVFTYKISQLEIRIAQLEKQLKK